jgi:hypothetical protein
MKRWGRARRRILYPLPIHRPLFYGVSNKVLLLPAVHQSLALPRYDVFWPHSNFDFDALWNRTADVALALPPLPAAHLKAKPRTAA